MKTKHIPAAIEITPAMKNWKNPEEIPEKVIAAAVKAIDLQIGPGSDANLTELHMRSLVRQILLAAANIEARKKIDQL